MPVKGNLHRLHLIYDMLKTADRPMTAQQILDVLTTLGHPNNRTVITNDLCANSKKRGIFKRVSRGTYTFNEEVVLPH